MEILIKAKRAFVRWFRSGGYDDRHSAGVRVGVDTGGKSANHAAGETVNQ